MIIIIIKISASIAFGLLAGLSAVYVFNHMPYKWLCDYGENPMERGQRAAEALSGGLHSQRAGGLRGMNNRVRVKQKASSGHMQSPAGLQQEMADRITRSLVDPKFKRIKENPWRWVYSTGFICLCLRLSLVELQDGLLSVNPDYAMYSSQMAAAGLVACWLMLIIALADMKYMIIPDQFVIMLALTGVGFAPVTGFREALIGFAIGGGFMLLCALAGKVIFKQDAFGFGDVKLCAAMGLVLGINGTVATVAAAVIISGFTAAIGLASGKYRKTDTKPLGPFLCGCGMAYILIAMPLLY